MPNLTNTQATLKERKRKDRVMERGEQARQLIKDALSWTTDDQAAWHLASCLVECRHCKLLAAIYNELQYMGEKTAYGARARRVVQQASQAIARELV